MSLGSRYNQHSFAQIPSINTPRSKFDRSHTVKDTFDFDFLTPCFVDEVYPGDTHNLTMKAFARLTDSATKRPIMDNYEIRVDFFYSPSRTLWDNYTKMMGEQRNPTDSIDYILPIIEMPVGGFAVGSIYDHMGLAPLKQTATVVALPFRMYNQIFNWWYRDQNFQDSLEDNYDSDGPDPSIGYFLKKSNKKHDYFTSMTKLPQKGDPVTIPIAGTAPVIPVPLVHPKMQGVTTPATKFNFYSANGLDDWKLGAVAGSTQQMTWDTSGLQTDLTAATSVQVNTLLTAIQLQQFLYVDSVNGTRYPEMVMGHFNVVVPDFRVQQPEFLGSGTFRFNNHPVAQTAPTSGGNAQGQLAAFATAAATGSNVGFTKSFVEHGYVMGIMRARADITYQQGNNKMWQRRTRLDIPDPLLQEVGDQAVKGEELYVDNSTYNAAIIGYQERYAELMYKPSEIRGLFRSQVPNTLDVFHLAEKFDTPPAINGLWLESKTPIERTLAVTTGPDILIDMWFEYHCTRPFMVRSVPAAFTRF